MSGAGAKGDDRPSVSRQSLKVSNRPKAVGSVEKRIRLFQNSSSQVSLERSSLNSAGVFKSDNRGNLLTRVNVDDFIIVETRVNGKPKVIRFLRTPPPKDPGLLDVIFTSTEYSEDVDKVVFESSCSFQLVTQVVSSFEAVTAIKFGQQFLFGSSEDDDDNQLQLEALDRSQLKNRRIKSFELTFDSKRYSKLSEGGKAIVHLKCREVLKLAEEWFVGLEKCEIIIPYNSGLNEALDKLVSTRLEGEKRIKYAQNIMQYVLSKGDEDGEPGNRNEGNNSESRVIKNDADDCRKRSQESVDGGVFPTEKKSDANNGNDEMVREESVGPNHQNARPSVTKTRNGEENNDGLLIQDHSRQTNIRNSRKAVEKKVTKPSGIKNQIQKLKRQEILRKKKALKSISNKSSGGFLRSRVVQKGADRKASSDVDPDHEKEKQSEAAAEESEVSDNEDEYDERHLRSLRKGKRRHSSSSSSEEVNEGSDYDEKTRNKVARGKLPAADAEKAKINVPGVRHCPSCAFKVDTRNKMEAKLSPQSLPPSFRYRLISKAKYHLARHFISSHLPANAEKDWKRKKNGKTTFKCLLCPHESGLFPHVVWHYIRHHIESHPLPVPHCNFSCPEDGCAFVAVGGNKSNDNKTLKVKQLASHVIRIHDTPRKSGYLVSKTADNNEEYGCTRCDFRINLKSTSTSRKASVESLSKLYLHFFHTHLRQSVCKL